MIFSHDGPLKYFDQARLDEEPWGGNKKQLLGFLLSLSDPRPIMCLPYGLCLTKDIMSLGKWAINRNSFSLLVPA